MIRSIADLMSAFAAGEIRQMNAVGLKHGPTIGAMYEGLTSKLLSMSIPEELNLQVVSGFIRGPANELSPQVDCMLVRGTGEPIPHTDHYIWPIAGVIVVLEVKKTLYGTEFEDAFEKLRAPMNQFLDRLIAESATDPTSLEPACRAYSQMTGAFPPPRGRIRDLSFERKLLLSMIALEQVSPIRIALGYEGFRSEVGLRTSLEKFVESRVGKRGSGLQSFPQLSISGNFSLVKLNGFPYLSRLRDDWWVFLASSRTNPMILMLELIWTRLHREYPELPHPWGEDLEVEILHPLLEAMPVEQNGLAGWTINTINLPQETLEATATHQAWQPAFVTKEQYAVFELLCMARPVSIKGEDIAEHARRAGVSVDTFVATMIDTSLAAIRDGNLELTTIACGCTTLPDGRFAVADNNSGRLMRWLASRNGEPSRPE